MPYSIRKAGNKFQVITTDTGKVHGTHPTKENAISQLKAMYVNAPPEKEKTKRRARTWADEYMIRGKK